MTLAQYIKDLTELAKIVDPNIPIGTALDEGGYIMEFEPVKFPAELITIGPDDDHSRGEVPDGQYIIIGTISK